VNDLRSLKIDSSNENMKTIDLSSVKKLKELILLASSEHQTP
jgi:hypothetical protein